MLNDEDIKEYLQLIMNGLMKNKDIARQGAMKQTAFDTAFKLMKENREAVEVSMRRFHNFLHRKDIGEEDYEQAKAI